MVWLGFARSGGANLLPALYQDAFGQTRPQLPPCFPTEPHGVGGGALDSDVEALRAVGAQHFAPQPEPPGLEAGEAGNWGAARAFEFGKEGGSTVELNFDWQNKRATGVSETKPVDIALPDGTQDVMSIQVEVMLDLKNGNLPKTFHIIDKKLEVNCSELSG